MRDQQVLIDPLEQPTTEPVAECGCCAHSWLGHDATARRYCAATLNMALTRGCICRT